MLQVPWQTQPAHGKSSCTGVPLRKCPKQMHCLLSYITLRLRCLPPVLLLVEVEGFGPKSPRNSDISAADNYAADYQLWS
jgi:hypothetical protein